MQYVDSFLKQFKSPFTWKGPGKRPGGAFIIQFTAKTRYGPMLLEAERFDAATIVALQARGHTVVQAPLPSGLQAIERTTTGCFGGAAPRREGVVLRD
jgi:gamma-glutamyltranspeptidase/glutathione hydrolase